MRHHKSGRKLNRNSSHRQAMFRNMAVSLFQHEQIRTTLPKAKELRRVAEPLITMAKSASLANRRLAFSRLRDRAAVTKLFDDLGIRFQSRPGGYLRILKCGYRPGDKAPMAIVQLVERQSAAAAEAPTKPKKEAKPTKKKDTDTVKAKDAAAVEAEKAAKEKVEKKASKKKPAAKKKASAKKSTTKKPAAKKTTKKKTTKKKTTKKKTTKKKTTKKSK